MCSSDLLTAAGYPGEDVGAVRLAVEQAAVNGIEHGHAGDPGKAVRLAWRFDERGLLARVEDDGPGFDPSLLPDPLRPDNPQRGGGGLVLIAASMTAVSYSRQRGRLTLWKSRTQTPAATGTVTDGEEADRLPTPAGLPGG